MVQVELGELTLALDWKSCVIWIYCTSDGYAFLLLLFCQEDMLMFMLQKIQTFCSLQKMHCFVRLRNGYLGTMLPQTFKLMYDKNRQLFVFLLE